MEYNWIGLEILENKHTLNFFFLTLHKLPVFPRQALGE